MASPVSRTRAEALRLRSKHSDVSAVKATAMQHDVALAHRMMAIATIAVTLAMAMMAVPKRSVAAEISARDVTQQLFQSSPKAPVDFSDMDLSFLDLSKLDFKRASLVGADLYGTDLSGANLREVDLSETRLDRAALANADMTGANLSGASLLRPNMFETLAFSNEETPLLRHANLSKARIIARMDGTDFTGANLRDADFSPMHARRDLIATSAASQLVACNFSETDMRGANLVRAKLVYAKFRHADLRGANFQEADLSRADFTGADVTGANFEGAILDGAIVENVKGSSAMTGPLVARNTESLPK